MRKKVTKEVSLRATVQAPSSLSTTFDYTLDKLLSHWEQAHESKHRNYKQGLAERMVYRVKDGFQQSVLPRLLLGQAKRIRDIGVRPLRLIPPLKEAPVLQKNLLGDDTLRTAKGLSYYHSTVHCTDILCFADGSAGYLQTILAGHNDSCFSALKQLVLEDVKPWGKIWRLSDQEVLISASAESDVDDAFMVEMGRRLSHAPRLKKGRGAVQPCQWRYNSAVGSVG